MPDDPQQMVDALKGQVPPTLYTQQMQPPRWGDYAKEALVTGGAVNPVSNLFHGPMTTEGATEAIMGMEPLIQILRGAKDVSDLLGVTKPMRSYPSQIGVLPDEKT